MDVFRDFCDEVHYFSEYGAERSDDSGTKKFFYCNDEAIPICFAHSFSRNT